MTELIPLNGGRMNTDRERIAIILNSLVREVLKYSDVARAIDLNPYMDSIEESLHTNPDNPKEVQGKIDIAIIKYMMGQGVRIETPTELSVQILQIINKHLTESITGDRDYESGQGSYHKVTTSSEIHED